MVAKLWWRLLDLDLCYHRAVSVHLLVKVIHGQWKKVLHKKNTKISISANSSVYTVFSEFLLGRMLYHRAVSVHLLAKGTAWWGNCYCYSNYFEQQGWSNSWPGVINHSGFHRQCWPLPNVRSVGSVDSVGLYLMCAAAKVHCCRTILGPIWPAVPRLSAWWW